MIKSLLKQKLYKLFGDMRLTYQQELILKDFMDQNFIEIGQQYSFSSEALNHYRGDLDEVREHAKQTCIINIGKELCRQGEIYQESYKTNFNGLVDQYTLLVFKGDKNEKN